MGEGAPGRVPSSVSGGEPVNPDIPLKTSEEVDGIRKSCQIACRILQAVAAQVETGISTLELDGIAADLMRHYDALPGVTVGFPGSICISVNEVAAHGVPSPQKLREGDIVTIDVAVLWNGWFGDAAASFGVGVLSTEKERLVAAAKRALAAAVQAARRGSRMGDVGAAVLSVAEEQQCVVLPEFVGHGIGRKLHEEPVVPHTGTRGQGLPIVAGMVFTLEPALSLEAVTIRKEPDGWSLRSLDRSPVAQFEHTVAVFANHTEVLTLPEADSGDGK